MRTLVVLLTALALTGCAAVRLPNPPSLAEDRRDLERSLDLMPALPRPEKSSGSLWTDAGPGVALVRDTRAFRVNDLVTVMVLESAAGQNSADTDLSRSSDYNFGAGVLFGLEDPSPTTGSFNLNNVLSSSSDSSFSGDGSTSRRTSLSGLITTRVARVLPNGDLLVAGEKHVTVNRDRQILTLVGTVRTVDVDANNRVSSGQVGDLVVRLWGHGEIDDTVRQGWFMRMFNKIWPL